MDKRIQTIAQRKIFEQEVSVILIQDKTIQRASKLLALESMRQSRKKESQIRREASGDSPSRGGAKGFMEHREGVDEYVYAISMAMKHMPGRVYKDWNDSHPQGNILKRREKPEKHVFDTPLEQLEVTKWPEHHRKKVWEAYQGAPAKGGIQAKTPETFFGELGKKSQSEVEDYLSKTLHYRKSRRTDTRGEPAMGTFMATVSPFGSEFRQHDEGGPSTVIVDPSYLQEARQLHKPLMSGPSGTAFRFLKHTDELRQGSSVPLPSMETARLVTMANLIRGQHHSYHEIMQGSENVGGLRYEDKTGYGDLQRVAPLVYQRALARMTPVHVKSVTELGGEIPVRGKKYFTAPPPTGVLAPTGSGSTVRPVSRSPSTGERQRAQSRIDYHRYY